MNTGTAERKRRKNHAKDAKGFPFILLRLLRLLRAFAIFAFGIWISTAQAQQPEDASITAERARLKAQRNKVEAEFTAQEKACYGKFAVNDCLDAARAKRRDAVGDLRRQEIALNDVQRKRNAAERRHSIDEKNAAQREREETAAPKAPDPQRALHSTERKPRDKEVVQKRQAEIDQAKHRRDAEAAKNAREHEEKLLQAREREERVKKRLAEKKKPPASSLKDPT
jgi:colicin import membrane protein